MEDTTLPGRVTYDQYRQFSDDGKRYEILDGRIFVTPAPSPDHQYASRQLQRMLEDYFESDGRYVVFNAPLDVIFADDEVVQPDLVVAGRSQVSRRGVEGAPHLIVEVLSPSNIPFDRQAKAERYRVRGVPHFWLLDPAARTLECFRLEGGSYQLEASGKERGRMNVPAFTGLTVTLETLWLSRD